MAQVACLLEVTARKPGNVHRLADFPGDAHYLDFLLSAASLVGPLDRARSIGVGPAVAEAVAGTRRFVANNTNLGMVLLLTPLACLDDAESVRPGVGRVLEATTVDDARAVYAAIRMANPGGLGEVPDQDVAAEPTTTLREVMRLAADRDVVARQYATGYGDVLDQTLPALAEALGQGRDLEAAISHAFLATLARLPDTLIARKRGIEVAREASLRASEALLSGEHAELDSWLRADGHARNPGATADLVAAALFVAIRDGTIVLPLPEGSWPALQPSR
jgi:triphosphoribosyl-dephospho-CoA synthase